MADTIIEKKLKQDIHNKNLLRREIERHSGSISRFYSRQIWIPAFAGMTP